MSLPALKATLDQLAEPSHVEGTYRLDERLAVVLPDGDVGAVDDATFVKWLLEHSEPAPFGEANKTRVDPKVRHAQRLVARGKAQLAGFDPARIMDQIEAALSPRAHLAAKLLDVVVYPTDGKFGRHKDTPYSPDHVGTLVVALPVAHTGGAFKIEDGAGTHELDWGQPVAGAVRWVALYSDVDHAVKPVLSGARVTVTYALTRTDRPRIDPTWEARRGRLRRACETLSAQDQWPVMIACSRHVVTDDKTQPQAIATLRGVDRDIAEVIAELGFQVVVRSCLVAAPSEGEASRFPATDEMYSVARLKKPLTPKVIAALDEIVTFSDEASDDEGSDLAAYSLAPYILDEVQLDQWVIRDNAAASLIHEALFSDTGYFGNEAYEAFIYTLGALEVTRNRR